ncbi:hypothetical protein FXO38_01110 [Capsicum annuum]|nr:hypothetical protein FXO38_01110 [Capsicum annuum]
MCVKINGRGFVRGKGGFGAGKEGSRETSLPSARTLSNKDHNVQLAKQLVLDLSNPDLSENAFLKLPKVANFIVREILLDNVGREGKRYVLVIVDDYSKFTSTMFLRTKNEIYEVLVIFAKQIHVKLNNKIAGIRSDHRTKFKNAKVEEFFSESGIGLNFSAPRTPQQNGVVERKNKTLTDIARTMLIDGGLPKSF